MEEDHVRRMIADAIRCHEVRVAVVSGIAGAALLAGTWHAVWLLRCWVLR
jgi:hypothetical protein